MTSNLTPYKMKGPRLMVPQWPPSSDMAQLTSGFYSTFVFLCCLVFLPASWEAVLMGLDDRPVTEMNEGANTFQELQKTGEASTSDHLLTVTPGLTHRAPSAHTDLDPGQRLSDLPRSTVTQKPRKQCNKVRLVKPVHKPIENSKATDNHQNTTVHHEVTPAMEKNASSQRKDPMIRNGRAADDPKSTNTEKGSEGSHSTSAPRRRTTCKSTTSKTRVTRNSVRPVDTSTRLRTTSHKPTAPSHDSELSRKTTSSPVKSSEAPRTSNRTPRTPATPGDEDHRTQFASDKPVQMTTEHIKETTSASEKTTRSQKTPAEHEGENTSSNKRTTSPQATPTQDEKETISANERTTSPQSTPTQYERETIPANERTTQAQVTFTDNERESVSTNRKTTRSQATPTQYERETLSANERTTSPQATPTQYERETIPANERTTQAQVTFTDNERESVSTNRKTTRSQATPTQYERETISANERTTSPQATPTQYERETISANERTTSPQATPTQYERETISANERTTSPQATPTQYERETISANERTTSQVMPIEHDTTLANEKTIQVSVESTKHPEGATSTTQKVTKVSESPTVFRRKTTLATKTLKATGNPEKTVAVLVSTGSPVKATEDKSTALSPHFHKAETTHQGVIDYVTTRTDLGFTTSEAHYPQQNSHSSPGGFHAAGARGENNSFPAWAIVVVILLAVIVLLISVGLIILVACASRTRRVLAQNSEDADFEDGGGGNSYPVYLMEQQNLKPNQIPSPP